MVTQTKETVSLGEMKVTRDRGTIYLAPNIGSSIVLVLYDPQSRVGGVAHVVLPESPSSGGTQDSDTPAKFADQAIPAFMEMFTKAGGQIRFANARIIGGAQMFNFGGGGGNSLNIGTRTATAIRAALSQSGIAVDKADVGGNKGKQVRFLVATGQVFVKVVGDRDYML